MTIIGDITMKRTYALLLLPMLSGVLASSSVSAGIVEDCDKEITIGMSLEDLGIKISGCTAIIETSENAELIAAGYTNRAMAHASQMDGENAVADATQAIKLIPGDANYYQNRGSLYLYFLDQPELAIADYEKGLSLAPADPSMYYTRGQARSAPGQVDQALEDFDKAIELNPDYGEAYFERGVIQFTRDLHDKAIIDFTQSIRLDDNLAMSYARRAIQFDLLGRTDEAINDSRKVLEINPSIEQAKIRLKALGTEP